MHPAPQDFGGVAVISKPQIRLLLMPVDFDTLRHEKAVPSLLNQR